MSDSSRPARRPIYRVEVAGVDITPRIDGRLISLDYTDNRGFEADQVDISIADTDGRLGLPSRGARLRVAFGWPDSGLVDKGEFTVDEVEHSGAPDILTIRGRSADLRSGLSTQRERSWHDVTLGSIVRTIAAENDLITSVDSALAGQQIEHIDQTNESDANLLTRLARQFDAIATVKDGRLLFMSMAGGRSASGQQLPAVLIRRQSGDRHRFAVADRETYTGVKALYNDVNGAARGEAVWTQANEDKARKKTGAAPAAAIAPSTDNVKTLRHVYASRTNALRAARAEWRRLQRGVATFSITLALGRADLFPELPATVEGFKREIDGTEWIVSKASHSISDSGFTTTLELEINATEIQD